jgi:hypothetical protein
MTHEERIKVLEEKVLELMEKHNSLVNALEAKRAVNHTYKVNPQLTEINSYDVD